MTKRVTEVFTDLNENLDNQLKVRFGQRFEVTPMISGSTSAGLLEDLDVPHTPEFIILDTQLRRAFLVDIEGTSPSSNLSVSTLSSTADLIETTAHVVDSAPTVDDAHVLLVSTSNVSELISKTLDGRGVKVIDARKRKDDIVGKIAQAVSE